MRIGPIHIPFTHHAQPLPPLAQLTTDDTLKEALIGYMGANAFAAAEDEASQLSGGTNDPAVSTEAYHQLLVSLYHEQARLG